MLAVLLRDPLSETVGGDAPALDVSVVRNEVKAFESAAESMPMIGTFLAASSIGLPSALNSVGATTTAAGFSSDGVLEDRNLAGNVRFGLGTELGNLDAEILARLAGSGEHDVPVERGCVFDDDRDCGLGGVTRRAEVGE
jgi:hypothetical protein